MTDRNDELHDNKANLNKAKLHMDTHMHTYTDTESALITSERIEAENRERCRTLPTPDINVPTVVA